LASIHNFDSWSAVTIRAASPRKTIHRRRRMSVKPVARWREP
jgi:hypothetical protein